MKEVIFGAWKVNLWEAFDGVFQGEAILTTSPKGVDVPSIMREGIQFLVTPEGLRGGEREVYFPAADSPHPRRNQVKEKKVIT